MTQLSREMDRLFEGFWGAPLASSRLGADDVWWSPAIEVHEHDGELLVRADLPGLTKDDVHVAIEDQALTIQGERKQGCDEERAGHYRSECRYGSFLRSIPLPADVDPGGIQADFDNGVLEVRVPIPERAPSRRDIEVHSKR